MNVGEQPLANGPPKTETKLSIRPPKGSGKYIHFDAFLPLPDGEAKFHLQTTYPTFLTLFRVLAKRY